MPEVRLVDREEYTSRTTGTVKQGETTEAADDVAGHLVRNRGFEYVGDDDAQAQEGEQEDGHEHEQEDEN
jgi:hypothetical protein